MTQVFGAFAVRVPHAMYARAGSTRSTVAIAPTSMEEPKGENTQ